MGIDDREILVNGLSLIQSIIDGNPGLSRTQLSKEVSKKFDWYSSHGKLQEAKARKYLLDLERSNLIKLPEAQPRPSHQKKDIDLDLVGPLETDLDQLGRIDLILIKNKRSKFAKVWRKLFDEYHYLGSGPIYGAQLKYLIRSSKYGWLGGLSFSSSSWRLEARDKWIGWDESSRKKHLQEVVNNSRFLILPQVKVKNLASHVMSKAIKRLAKDWQKQYGIRPLLLESFVDSERYQGISYKASNWQYVGKSKGRGRNDRNGKVQKSEKLIYLYPLSKDALSRLSDGAYQPKLLEDKWIYEEFGGVDLSDKRLENRLLTIVKDFYINPGGSIPQICRSRSKSKATYRFLSKKEHTLEKLLEQHYRSSLERIKKESIVLAVQDTTEISYSGQNKSQGLGPIGHKKEGKQGALLHDTMAFNLSGTPLGLIDVQYWSRKKEDFGKRHKRYDLPIEEKESNKWLKSYESASRIQRLFPGKKVVSIGDRESDIYELFRLVKETDQGADILIRAVQKRRHADDNSQIWDYLRHKGQQVSVRIEIPKRTRKPSREAQLRVYYSKLKLKPPKSKPGLGEVELWGILAEEENYDGRDRIRWNLLTSLPVTDKDSALEKLTWYSYRWGIETYHKVLKSGCKIEARQLGHIENLESALAIDLVIAWRIFYITMYAREHPNAPCTEVLEDYEWKSLVIYINEGKKLPRKPPTIREARDMIAQLGGYLGRKNDGPPGVKTMWVGMKVFEPIAKFYQIYHYP